MSALAKIAKYVGMTKKAIELYDRAGELENAAITAKEAGMADTANQFYSKVIQNFEQEGQFGKAAESAEEAGMTKKAIELYKKAGWLTSAGFAASKAGLNEMATELFEKAGDFVQAGRAAKRAGLTEKADELYLRKIEQYVQNGELVWASVVAEEAIRATNNEYFKKMLGEYVRAARESRWGDEDSEEKGVTTGWFSPVLRSAGLGTQAKFYGRMLGHTSI